MLALLLVWMLSAVAIFITSKNVNGFEIKSFGSAMGASLAVGFLNMFLRPLFLVLTLPINILTLGLFTFVVNAAILRLAAGMLKNFEIKGWGPALIGAVMLALINILVLSIFPV